MHKLVSFLEIQPVNHKPKQGPSRFVSPKKVKGLWINPGNKEKEKMTQALDHLYMLGMGTMAQPALRILLGEASLSDRILTKTSQDQFKINDPGTYQDSDTRLSKTGSFLNLGPGETFGFLITRTDDILERFAGSVAQYGVFTTDTGVGMLSRGCICESDQRGPVVLWQGRFEYGGGQTVRFWGIAQKATTGETIMVEGKLVNEIFNGISSDLSKADNRPFKDLRLRRIFGESKHHGLIHDIPSTRKK